MRMWLAALLIAQAAASAALAMQNSQHGVYSDVLKDAYGPESAAFIVQTRRALHQIPERSWDEHQTSQLIQKTLQDLDIQFQTGDGTAVIGTIGPSSGPKVALRADMDALPIQEPSDLQAGKGGWSSQHPGLMHACGHDTHMAMLLGAARLLKARESQLSGQVVLVFQPAEEGGGGAKGIISGGYLKDVQAISGLHVWPGMPSGTIGTKAGPIMAASDRFAFKVQGRGGHGAMPHLAADPVVAASAIVLALQTLVSRETSPLDSAVVTVGVMQSGPGGACNIISDWVEIQGTIRSLKDSVQQHLRKRVEEVAVSTAQAYGVSITEQQWSGVPYPPTVNDAQMAALAMKVAGNLAAVAKSVTEQGSTGHANDGSTGDSTGEAASAQRTCSSNTQTCDATSDDNNNSHTLVTPNVTAYEVPEPTMAAEDFSFYGQQIPAVFTWLGTGNEQKATTASLHNPQFQMDEDVMPLGAALHVAMALEMLEHASSQVAASAN